MVQWQSLCIPTDFGGLGIMDTRLMNDAPVGKWGWRMHRADKDDLCYQLLKRKYLKKHSFWVSILERGFTNQGYH